MEQAFVVVLCCGYLDLVGCCCGEEGRFLGEEGREEGRLREKKYDLRGEGEQGRDLGEE